MENCLFCKIANKQIKSDIVHEDNDIVAFKDINPQAPVHVIIIPRKHIERISEIEREDSTLIGDMFLAAVKIARENDIEKTGYRLVINCNKDAGQEVFHIHLHLLGGRKFMWPPG